MSALDATWLATLLALGTTALMGVDLQGRVVFWSQGAEALFGWAADEALGQRPPSVPLALQEEWHVQMQRVLDSGAPTTAAETQRITRDGRTISVVHTSAPVRDASGEICGVLDVAIDATALRQLDEESRALAQVRERDLVAMDLHDGLIQSLYAIVLNLAAREQALGQAQPGAVEAIKSARGEVERAIAETRAYVATLRGRTFTPRNLGAGLALLADGLRLNTGIDVQLSVDPRLEPLLAPEVRGHLLYLVREAVSNVIRHASASKVSISLSSSDGSAVLMVEDNGRGFDAADGSRSMERQRGLHNMAERARLVGGKLTIDSTPERGTQVLLELPL